MSRSTYRDTLKWVQHRFGDAQWKVNAQKLLGANLLAQAINLAFIPLLTRIYPPADYAVLATLMAVAVIGSLVAALGFDYAIPIVEDDEEAISLTQAAVYSALGLTIPIGIAACFLDPELLSPVLGSQLAEWAPWVIGFIIFAGSLSTTLEAFQIRHKRVGIVGWARVSQACVGIGSQIGLGLAGFGALGLVIGYALFLVTPGIIHIVYLGLTRNLTLSRWSAVRSAASAHRKYLHYTAPEALFNALSVYGPFMIISYFGSDPVITAHISLALRLLQAPSFLVAKIGSQLVQGSVRDWQRAGSVAANSRKICLGLSVLGVVGGVPVILLAPPLAGPILGPEWTGIGWVIAMLVPGVILHMISFPLIPIAYLRGQNANMMLLTSTAAILRNGLCALALPSGGLAVAVAFSGGAVVQYAILTAYLFKLSRTISKTDTQNAK